MLFGEGEFSVAEKISEIILYSLAGLVIISVLILTLIFIVIAIIQNIVRAFGVRGDSEDENGEKSSPKIIYFLSAAVLTVLAVLIIFLLII